MGKNGKRINPDIFDFPGGCYHCGQKGHSRTANPRFGTNGCPEYEALKNKGLPGNYEGALEKFIRE